MGLKQKAVMLLDAGFVLANFTRLIFNPKNIGPIFRGRSLVNHRAFQLALESLKADPATAQLIQERYLAPATDLDTLMALPEGTLGRVFAEHMRDARLELVFYPPLEATDGDDDIGYMRMRARQSHDIHHVVLGMPANELGEMMISAFYLAQNRIPLSAMLLGFGFLAAILRWPERIDDLLTVIIHGWTTGKEARCKFLGVRWEEYWELPIAEVRQMVGVTAAYDRPGFPAGTLDELPPAPLLAFGR